MTPPTLCLNVTIPRANAFELGRLHHLSASLQTHNEIRSPICAVAGRCRVAGGRYSTHIGQIAPPNSAQKLTRPGAGPAAEPPSQLTSVAGGMPPASLIARRFAARL